MERKSSPKHDQVLAVVVAFANSVPPGREAVLFLGVRPDGTTVGLDNPDALQRKLNEWLEETYPRVQARFEVLGDVGPRPILAVVVGASEDRPHFAGPAWVRSGSETKKAPPDVYDDLIASRNTKAGAILRHIGQVITVIKQERWLASWNSPEKVVPLEMQCRIESCSAHSVELRSTSTSQLDSFSLERVIITTDTRNQRPLMLTIKPE